MMNKSREIRVETQKELYETLEMVLPGDEIVLKQGIWSDVHIQFKGTGTEDKPVTLRAEMPGEVIITGRSTLSIAGEYLVVDGLYFKEGVLSGASGETAVVSFEPGSKYCRLTNTAIVDYNPSEKVVKYFWLTLDGSHHRVDHCYFKGKNHAGQLLKNIKYSHHNRIDHNCFIDIPAYGINGLEIIQVMGIGSDGELGNAGGEYVVIENNLFERADGECAEIISLKSNHDIVRNNTFRESQGGLVIRSGHNTTVEGNYFNGEHLGGSQGIRITGDDNRITNNYLTGLQDFVISVMAGEYIEKPLTGEWNPVLRKGTPLGRVPMYNQARNNHITENVLVDNEGIDIEIGYMYKAYWPKRQQILMPENGEFSNNIVVKKRSKVFKIAEVDRSIMNTESKPMHFNNNIICGADPGVEPVPDGITVAAQPPFLTEDFLQSIADGEVNTQSKGSIPKPLTEEEVGPEWVKNKRTAGDPLLQRRDNFATIETVPWDHFSEILVFRIGSSDAFVKKLRTKIDPVKRHLSPVKMDGKVLLPVRFTALMLGDEVVWKNETQNLWIKHKGSEINLGPEKITKTYGDTKSEMHCGYHLINDEVFLEADVLASMLDRKLRIHKNDIIVLSNREETLSLFTDDAVMEKTLQLFKVVASSFHMIMTNPSPGESYGDLPVNTLSRDPSTCWTAYGDGQWIRYDLGACESITEAAIAFKDGEKYSYTFGIETSVDGLTWTKVFYGQSSGKTSEIEKFTFEKVTARFVKIVGHMNTISNRNSYRYVQFHAENGRELL